MFLCSMCTLEGQLTSQISLCVCHGSFLAYVATYIHVILERYSEGYNVFHY